MEGTIQYGYRTRGTHARVFSQTLAHGNSKNEIGKKQTKKVRRDALSLERSTAGIKKRIPDGLSHPNKNTIIISEILYYFIRDRKSTMKFN